MQISSVSRVRDRTCTSGHPSTVDVSSARACTHVVIQRSTSWCSVLTVMQQFKQADHVVVSAPESLSAAAWVRHDGEHRESEEP